MTNEQKAKAFDMLKDDLHSEIIRSALSVYAESNSDEPDFFSKEEQEAMDRIYNLLKT